MAPERRLQTFQRKYVVLELNDVEVDHQGMLFVRNSRKLNESDN